MEEMVKYFLELNVYSEFDKRYGVHAAYCLETGSVVTADDPDTAESMMVELLQDEATYAVENNNLANLLANPAPLEIRAKWLKVAETKGVRPLIIKIRSSEQMRLLLGRAEVESEVRIARAA